MKVNITEKELKALQHVAIEIDHNLGSAEEEYCEIAKPHLRSLENLIKKCLKQRRIETPVKTISVENMIGKKVKIINKQCMTAGRIATVYKFREDIGKYQISFDNEYQGYYLPEELQLV